MMRRTALLDVYLARHAEANKNLGGVHGGGDQRLTARGEAQARDLGTSLRDHVRSARIHVVHQPDERSAATARHIGALFDTDPTVAPESASLGLGDAQGLSEKELANRLPEWLARLKKWQEQGSKLLSYPQAPHGEAPRAFYARIRGALVVHSCLPSSRVPTTSRSSLWVPRHR